MALRGGEKPWRGATELFCCEGEDVDVGVCLLGALGLLEEMLADALPWLVSRSLAASIKEAVAPFNRDPCPRRRRTLIEPTEGGDAS